MDAQVSKTDSVLRLNASVKIFFYMYIEAVSSMMEAEVIEVQFWCLMISQYSVTYIKTVNLVKVENSHTRICMNKIQTWR